MNHHDITGAASGQSLLTRRVFAAGMLGTLAASFSLPAAAQGLKGVDEDDDQNTRDDDEPGDIPENWEEIGIISEFTYESPQFGYSVEWEEPWKVDENDPGESDPGETMDSLNLLHNVHAQSGDGCYILGVPPLPAGIHGHHESLYTEEGRREWFGDDYEVELLLANENEVAIELVFRLVKSTAVIILMLQCFEVTPESWVLTTVVAGDDTIEDVFNGLQDQVRLNGDSIVALTTWRDLERVIG